MSVVRRLRLAACAVLLLAGAIQQVAAHAGHDDPEPVVSAPGAPRATAASDAFEFVAIAADGTLKIYLDSFVTNAPVLGATIEIGSDGGDPVRAEAQEDGTYLLRAPWLGVAGAHDLVVAITADGSSDLLTATLVLPPDTMVAPAHLSKAARIRGILGAFRTSFAATLAFMLGMLTVLAMRAGGRWRVLSGVSAVVVGLLISGVALAKGEASRVAPQAVGGDMSRRQPDGSVVMPKDAQRLLAVRTVPAQEGAASRTVQVIGQVVADPNAAGRVQSSQPGRIEPGAYGLAHVGMRVTAGDILAVIAPAIAALERGAVGAQVAEVEQQLRMAEQKMSRLAGLSGSVAGREIDEARAELAGARARRAALAPTLAGREVLRAPVSGIVSAANVVNGQFVEGKDVLFEIVDPARLWIEAFGFDPLLAGEIRGGSAILADGAPVDVELVGRGLALRQGAVPLLFRIATPPAGLPVGASAIVIVRLPSETVGIALPRASVVRMPNGGAAVWDHVAAEHFVLRPVRFQPLDGTRVLILAGLKPGQRIVSQGADLLNQVR